MSGNTSNADDIRIRNTAAILFGDGWGARIQQRVAGGLVFDENVADAIDGGGLFQIDEHGSVFFLHDFHNIFEQSYFRACEFWIEFRARVQFAQFGNGLLTGWTRAVGRAVERVVMEAINDAIF